MKKILKIIMALMCCIALVGCGENRAESMQKEVQKKQIDVGDGAKISYESEGRTDVNVDKIPYEKIKYNDEEFSLKSVKLFSERSESGHGYIPFVLVQYDLNSLTEDSLYWITKDFDSDELLKTLGTHIYISSKNNNLTHERMEKTAQKNDSGIITYVFALKEEYKNDFLDMEISLHTDVEQDEKYKHKNSNGEISEINKTISYTWYINSVLGNCKIPVSENLISENI